MASTVSSEVKVLEGDCRDVLRTLPNESVHCVVTSPPYFGLRDYGVSGQIGLESAPAEYVARLVEVFREVRRVLRDDGTLWLNLGDSYTRNPAKGGSGPNGKHDFIPSYGDARKKLAANAVVGSSDGSVGRADRPGTRASVDGLKEKDLIGIPWRVAFALQQDGWYLRQDIIWHKPNPMPESVRDRCTKAHEYIFLLSKSEKYYFDSEAIKEPSVTNDPRRPYGSFGANVLDSRGAAAQGGGRLRAPANVKRGEFNGKTNDLPGREAFRAFTETRNKRSVWTVTTKPFKGAHFATFPPDLIEPCVLAGCPVGGTVLDPFGGAGTTGVVAQKHGRNAILCELNPEYVKMARQRIAAAAPQPTCFADLL
jgi:DNA modification methylase